MTITEYTPDVLDERLAAGLGNKGGARGSLTRCANRLSSTTTTTKEEKLVEVQLLHLELFKQALQCERAQQEFNVNTQDDLDTAIAEERKAVAQLTLDLQHARQVQACLQEYESLATLITKNDDNTVMSKRQLQSLIDKLQDEIKSSQTELATQRVHAKIRRAQVQNFLQSMLDLKQSLNSPLELTRDERAAVQEELNNVQNKANDNDDEDAMEVVDAGKKGEEGLYEDM